MKDTGWKIDKLRANKISLEAKFLISIEKRFNQNRQTSNYYKVLTDLISVFVTAKNLTKNGIKEGEGSEKPTGIKNGKTNGGEGSEKPTTEVLTREEVLTEDSKESSIQKALFVEDKPTIDKPETNKTNTRARAKEPKIAGAKTEVLEEYHDFVRIWTEAYPDLGFSGLDGKKIKSLIGQTKAYLLAGGREPTKEATIAMFAYVVAYLKREGGWYNGKDLSIIDSKYRTIIFEIKNGKQTSTPRKRSVREIINSL